MDGPSRRAGAPALVFDGYHANKFVADIPRSDAGESVILEAVHFEQWMKGGKRRTLYPLLVRTRGGRRSLPRALRGRGRQGRLQKSCLRLGVGYAKREGGSAPGSSGGWRVGCLGSASPRRNPYFLLLPFGVQLLNQLG
jgi:hypothetical protein